MADAPAVHIGENSPEHVAYRLMERVAFFEGKLLTHNASKAGAPLGDRKWLLDTYAECLLAIQNPSGRGGLN